ncbi:MAG: alpha-ketoacid dehydrogenase subunit beta [Actinomycetota bacterium]
MKTLTLMQAINEALLEEMERDPNSVYFGEDVAAMSGAFGATAGLLDRFGPDRVFDTPIAEATIAGAALGMALAGLTPITEFSFADFVGIAFDEIYNKLGKWNWMHGCCFKIPVTIRLPVGALAGSGPEHSQSPQALFMHSQGLYVAVPSNACDAKGLLKTAIRDPNPVLFFEHKLLYGMPGEVPEEEYTIPFGVADVKREGSDVTIVATSMQVLTALNAANMLAAEGIEAEVIDPRTLIPLDRKAILDSVRKTGRVVIVHEEPKTGGTGAELAAIIAEEAFFDLAAPIKRVGSADTPIPQSIFLEMEYKPNEEKVMAAVREVMQY